jgi:hypothetical protein
MRRISGGGPRRIFFATRVQSIPNLGRRRVNTPVRMMEGISTKFLKLAKKLEEQYPQEIDGPIKPRLRVTKVVRIIDEGRSLALQELLGKAASVSTRASEFLSDFLEALHGANSQGRRWW